MCIDNIVHTNLTARARHSSSFTTCPQRHLRKLTATVTWADHTIDQNLLTLARPWYASQGYKVTETQCQQPQPSPAPGSPPRCPNPPVYLKRNHAVLRQPCTISFQQTSAEDLTEIVANTDIHTIYNALPPTLLAHLLELEPLTLPLPSTDTTPDAHLLQQMAKQSTHNTGWHVSSAQTFIHLDTKPVHPYKDLNYAFPFHTGLFLPNPHCSNTTDIYDPAGRYVQSLPDPVITSLQDSHARAAATPETELPHPTTRDTFSMQLILTLKRHECTYLHPPRISHVLSIDALTTHLITVFDIKQHRFCNPLTKNPRLETYYSDHADDCHMGATHGNYSCVFLGSSLATPPENPATIYAALQWAVMSCFQTPPSLTVFLLPLLGQDTGYTSWFTHKFVTILCTISPKSGKGNPMRPPTLRRPGLQIAVVSNHSARARWRAKFNMTEFCKLVRANLPTGYTILTANGYPATPTLPPFTKPYPKPQYTRRMLNILRTFSASHIRHSPHTRLHPEPENPDGPTHACKRRRTHPTAHHTHIEAILLGGDPNGICRHTHPGAIYFTDGSSMDVPTASGTVRASGSAFVTFTPSPDPTADPYTPSSQT